MFRSRVSVYSGVIFLTLLMPLRAETARTTSRLNLRQGPSTASPSIELLPLGQELDVMGRQGLWLRVRAGGNEGWVHADYVAGLRQLGRQAGPARAAWDAELARDVALLRVRHLEEELATLRRSSSKAIDELVARLAERELQIAELVDEIVDSSGSGPTSDAAMREGVADRKLGARVSDRMTASASGDTQTSLVVVAVPLFESQAAEHSDANITREAIQAVRRWAAAWSRQDVAGYLAAYDAQFRPASGVDHRSWVAQQRVLLTAPSFLEVVVSDMAVSVLAPGRVAVEFEQTYRSNSSSDRVHKTLDLARRGGSWKIVREESD